mgnify:FL=1
MRHIPYIINLDGEQFIGNGLKDKIKRVILHGASGYLVAGEKSGETLANALGLSEDLVNVKITPYYFSSLSEQEIEVHSKDRCIRNNKVLVIGQYFDYKGMDVAYEVAKRTPYISYKFIGMGNRTSLFLKERTGGGHKLSNVEIIPFLQKQELAEEYKQCGCLLLPSRQECWGLVVNEASSFGTPIVSTWGSGAAVEFLSDEYPQYLAKPGDSESLLNCLLLCLNSDNSQYSQYLMEKSKNYSIERSVDCHRKAIEMLTR